MEGDKGKKFVWRNGKMIDITNGDPDRAPKEEIHTVINDAMDETLNPVNGKAYTSRSKYEKVVKDHGGVIVGNEKTKDSVDRKPKDVKRDLLRTWEVYEQMPKEISPDRREEWARDVIKERG